MLGVLLKTETTLLLRGDRKQHLGSPELFSDTIKPVSGIRKHVFDVVSCPNMWFWYQYLVVGKFRKALAFGVEHSA